MAVLKAGLNLNRCRHIMRVLFRLWNVKLSGVRLGVSARLGSIKFGDIRLSMLSSTLLPLQLTQQRPPKECS